jgi:hypothetical protein
MTRERFGGAEIIDKAQELNPFGTAILADPSLNLLDLERYMEAQSIWARLEKSDPTYLPPHWFASESAQFDHEAASYLIELRAIAQISCTRRFGAFETVQRRLRERRRRRSF